jgi:alpha-glucoside transport system permease protein
MPMAISFVGAAVIFKLIYDTRPVGQDQIGILNAVWLAFDGGTLSVLFLKVVPVLLIAGFAVLDGLFGSSIRRCVRFLPGKGPWPIALVGSCPARCHHRCCGVADLAVAWCDRLAFLRHAALWRAADLADHPVLEQFFLMVVLIWIQTGFAMVILSAALRGIPEETIEAAVVDGANPFQIFFKIKVPQIMGTIVVVWTTITIVVLKVFDIVFAMTNGQWETQVLANYMYDKLFRANDWGVGSASAMVIMLLVTPILVWNVYNARKEMR